MNGIIAVVKKELRSYFYSPMAYVLIGIFLFIMGVIFAKFVGLYESYNQAQRFGAAAPLTLDKLATYLYQNMAFILCIITPFLTMRLFAEEKRQQTLEMLLTAPLRTGELVFAKYLAALLLMSLMIGLSGIYAFFMILWGNPEVRLIASTYLGLLLSMSCYVALGTLISSLFSSQAIAAVWTFIVLLLLWLFQSFGQGMTATTGFIEWGPLMVYLSPLGHLNSFSEGLIQLKSVIYFVTFTAFMLFLTHRVVESHRWR